ncbi:MAG: HAD family hydrolase [Candidatus Rokubacteria bacterium]|nr:HAD family hydrolase [Candidatus Rokubacteria bacterium]
MKALLLDLDDTLLDYSGGVDESWSAACVACCVSDEVDAARLIAALRPTRRWFWDDPERHRTERLDMPRAWTRIVRHALERIGVTDERLADTIARDFAARRRERMRLFPEAIACLEQLRREGVPLGLVTNGDARQQRYKIERWDLAKYFDVMVIEGEFGAGKPDEAVYRHALAKLGVAAGDTCMVGDNLEFDVEGAQRLGVRGMWVDREGRGLPAGSGVRPWRIIRSLAEIR